MSEFKAPRNNQEMMALCDTLSKQRHFRPLPKKTKQWFHDQYHQHLNGFSLEGGECQRSIGGTPVLANYTRVVVGDFGAYVEFDDADLLVIKTVAVGQQWRLDKKYLERSGLAPKYVWYEVCRAKCYHQLGTVTYADYKVGKLYIHVCEFDPIEE